MLISKLGEFGLIKKIRTLAKLDSSVIKGIGDDCAVLKFDRRRYLLLTCDMIVEGVDFVPKEKPELIGRKALAVSISDIAACAGIPRYAVVSLGIPKKATLEFMDGFLKGIFSLAREYRINLVGGDISRASRLVVDVTMLGFVEKKHLILRSGAKKGDIIFVTGRLGGSIRGKRHLTFVPRVKEARFLAKNFKPNSTIDISDGLLLDLGHILQESKVGAVIYEQLIPLHKDARNLKEALSMGEDFELLFTLPRSRAYGLMKRKQAGFFPIGEIVAREYGLKLVDRNTKCRPSGPEGYAHF